MGHSFNMTCLDNNMASLLDMLIGGFKAPANTQNYRKEFGDWERDRQINGGNTPQMDFDSWMKKFYPQIPYVPGGGIPKQSSLMQDSTFLS